MIRVAAVQAAPVALDLEGTVGRTLELIEEAASLGARLIVFPETWLPGYPAWLDSCRDTAVWDHPATQDVFARLVENSVTVPGPVTEALADAARRHEITLNISAHERLVEGPGRGTLYNAMLTFAPDGTLLNHHRKMMPTFSERLVWGMGDASGVRAVDTPAGRLGGLICWEHWMPLPRQALHDSGEDIHVAVWPWVREMHLVASRHYAFEGRCFVIASGSIMPARDLPAELEPLTELVSKPDTLILRGGSAIVGPDGAVLAGPVLDEQTILTADLDLSEIARQSMTLDVSGHYARPDLFDFHVRPRP